MKTKQSGGTLRPLESLKDWEDWADNEQQRRLLDTPPNTSSLDDEPWWKTALGVLALAAAFIVVWMLS